MIGVKKIMLKVCLCESNIVSIKFVTSKFVKKKKIMKIIIFLGCVWIPLILLKIENTVAK